MKKKILLLVLGGIVMIGADYFNAYYDQEWIFFLSEVASLGGWVLFVLALETKCEK